MTLWRTALGLTLASAWASGVVGCSDGVAASPRFDAGPYSDVVIVPDDDGGDASDGSSGDGCYSGGQMGATCTPFVSCADLATPTVSFAADIAPVLNASCGIGGATCHQDPSSVPFFDVAMMGAKFVLSTVVNKPAPEDSAIDIVKPGQPEQSMLMHKLDDDQCQFAAACNRTGVQTFENCGQRMPINSPQLSVEARDTFRRWIAQGALDN